MKIIEMLKYLIFALILLSIITVVFEVEIVGSLLIVCVPLVIFAWYYKESKSLDYRIVFILLFLYLGRVMGEYMVSHGLFIQIVSFGIAYSGLFYFFYQNNGPFEYSSRDLFTIGMASTLSTIIFIITLLELYAVLGGLTIPATIMILLLYVLLITAGIQYVRIRSEQSMWFFLVMLSFTVSDISLILDTFYLSVKELQVLKTIYHPLALFFLIKYSTSDDTVYKSKSLQSF